MNQLYCHHVVKVMHYIELTPQGTNAQLLAEILDFSCQLFSLISEQETFSFSLLNKKSLSFFSHFCIPPFSILNKII